ncbi:hypothetical protein, partial [Mesomycoplasma ovipneumoniae]|uniref:hypothetical protein n=1 Tax=Mesomycoplasma ovipneumoniae TaxID=29562 RepID=UPI00307FDE03
LIIWYSSFISDSNWLIWSWILFNWANSSGKNFCSIKSLLKNLDFHDLILWKSLSFWLMLSTDSIWSFKNSLISRLPELGKFSCKSSKSSLTFSKLSIIIW